MLPKVLKVQVIEAYMGDSYSSLAELADQFQVNLLTLKSWIYTKDARGVSIKDKKAALQEEIRKEAVRVSVQELSKSLKVGGQILSDILFKLQDDLEKGKLDVAQQIKVFSMISTSLKNVHGTIRLEDGKSTSNLAYNAPSSSESLKEALKAIKNDPFGNYGETIDVK